MVGRLSICGGKWSDREVDSRPIQRQFQLFYCNIGRLRFASLNLRKQKVTVTKIKSDMVFFADAIWMTEKKIGNNPEESKFRKNKNTEYQNRR